jgi:hypothetical protein
MKPEISLTFVQNPVIKPQDILSQFNPVAYLSKCLVLSRAHIFLDQHHCVKNVLVGRGGTDKHS